jgi:hypothetical protein
LKNGYKTLASKASGADLPHMTGQYSSKRLLLRNGNSVRQHPRPLIGKPLVITVLLIPKNLILTTYNIQHICI